MASQQDTEDLYADLYADGGAVAGAGDAENGDDKETDLIPYEDDAQPTKASFIPPAPTTSKSSFIPAAPLATPTTAADTAPTSYQESNSAPQQQQLGYQGTCQYAQQSGQPSLSAPTDGRPIMPHEMPEEGKMFVGGLNWDTTDDSLRNYFSQFGKIGHCTIMRDQTTGRSRGFAFLTFVDPKAVNTVMVREHYLDGKVIDPKRAIPRPEQTRTQKVFVGGLPQTVTAESFRQYFEQFGAVLDSTCMMDKETGNPRGFGFISFQDEGAVEHVLSIQPINFEGKMVEVKRAQSRSENQQAGVAPRQQQQQPYRQQQSGMMNPMVAMGGGAFDPQAMAKMYQQMGWGQGNWNPQMAWQQMMAMSGMDMSAMGGINMLGVGAMNMGGGGGWGQGRQQQRATSGVAHRREGGRDGGRQVGPPTTAGLPNRPNSGSTGSPDDRHGRERSPQRNERSYNDRSQRY